MNWNMVQIFAVLLLFTRPRYNVNWNMVQIFAVLLLFTRSRGAA